MEQQKKSTNNKDAKDDLKKIVYFTTIPFQMAAITALGAWGGIQVDKIFDTKPIFTVILTILSVLLAIYYAIKDFLKFKK